MHGQAGHGSGAVGAVARALEPQLKSSSHVLEWALAQRPLQDGGYPQLPQL